MRTCRQILQNGANINRSQAAARGLLPTQASHIWVSLHNVFRGEILERDSVRSLCRFPAVRSAAASLFIFMMFLGICEQIRSRTSKEKKSQKGKSKFPKVLSFSCVFCIMESFFFRAFPAHLYFLEKSTQHGPDVLLHGICSQVSISSLHSRPPEGGGRLLSACIMPELFYATGSLNFCIHPRSFAFCGPFTVRKPTEEEQGICLPCSSIVTIPMLPSTVTMTCG